LNGSALAEGVRGGIALSLAVILLAVAGSPTCRSASHSSTSWSVCCCAQLLEALSALGEECSLGDKATQSGYRLVTGRAKGTASHNRHTGELDP